jgi:hypothetical protein
VDAVKRWLLALVIRPRRSTLSLGRYMEFTKLKDQLLKSSLPLELEAGNGLAAEGFYVSGEFNYERPNETGSPRLFSVDVLASSEPGEFKELVTLVECKYTHDSNIWLFTSFPESQEVFMGDLGVTNPLNRYEIGDLESLYKFIRPLPATPTGIVLSERSSNPDPIRKGIHQLRYAVPNLMFRDYRFSADQIVRFYALIMLTNAELFHLHDKVTVQDVRDAGALKEVANSVDVLAIYRDFDEDIIRYCNEFERRGSEFNWLPPSQPSESVEGLLGFCEAISPLFVVRLGAFREWISGLKRAIKNVSVSVT